MIIPVHKDANVGFNGGVDGDDAETADNFRAVGYFRGTEHQFVAEKVHIPVNAFQAVVRHGQGAGAAEFHAAFPNQADDGILDDFRVHLERGNRLVAAQGAQHRVCDVAHARLERQERGGNDAPFHVGSQEIGHVLPDFIGQGIRCGEGTGFIRPVCFYDTYNLFRVDLYIR